jgi:aspartate ammonia-lyase
MGYRTEHDVLGAVRIDSRMYYGSETERARKNFPVSGIVMYGDFIRSYAALKKAAALANIKLGKLDREKGMAIAKASTEVMAGKYCDQFVVDVFQAGAGTSTNMNLNEVIANVAIESLHGRKGNYRLVHPNDHVNMSQSTNDTYHCAMRIASYKGITGKLLPELKMLQRSLHGKITAFSEVTKIGRTHLQDAVPMTLGEEFSGYEGIVMHSIKELEHAADALLELPIGGTALGTGINAPKGYASEAIRQLNAITRARFRQSDYIFADMQSENAELVASNALKDLAIGLGKIANDMRLLGSGPRAGMADITLPAVQPGSSIMPGKINPSMAEMLNMVCFQVMGNSHAIDEAANAGQLELNVFMPLIAFNLMFSLRILPNAVHAFNDRLVKGVKANAKELDRHLEMNISLATALSPYIGYAKAAQVARIAYKEGKSVKQVCIEKHIMGRKELDRILDSKRLV